MAKLAKRVALIGLDCCMPTLLQKYIDEGAVPNLAKLAEKGTFAECCLGALPTITPPNWATIATGAWPGTHGVTCFHYHQPGTNPDNTNIFQSWSSNRWQAEPIWDAADKAGKKCIVLTFPGSWPSHMKNGVIVSGDGFIPGDHRDGMPHLDAEFGLSQDFVISNRFGAWTQRGDIVDADGWKNIPDDIADEDPLSLTFTLPAKGVKEDLSHIVWQLLIYKKPGEDDYTQVAVCTQKDWNTAFAHLGPKEWSKKCVTTLKLKGGEEKEVFFRFKNMELDPDGEEVRTFMGAMITTDGDWCSRPELAAKILNGDACLHRSGGMHLYMTGKVIDLETYLEISEELTKWLTQAATNLMDAIPDWDLFYMHSHPIDWYYHAEITNMALEGESKAKTDAWYGHKRIFMSEDKMVGKIVEKAGKDTLVGIVSDHGATPDGPVFNPFEALIQAGLATREVVTNAHEADDPNTALLAKVLGHTIEKINWAKTRAVPQRETYVYINLKGRDPNGIVDPKDYEQTQLEIIDALYAYRDPNMGNRRPVALAITKRDAAVLGLYGDRIGDVIYTIYPEWGAQHGPILPTAVSKPLGETKTTFILSGPNIKKGYRITRPNRLVDLVPTLCYCSGLPYPINAEGAVVYEALQDPNIYVEEINKLKASLESMERAMNRDTHEPWDKHDCA